MASPYQPLELGQTRILCVHPGERGTPLHGHLETLQLDNVSSAKPYSAISYAWASCDLPNSIQLSHGIDIAITASLHGALQRFRNPSVEKKIWADAVCISQTDIEEKSAQVLGIKDVFAQAHEILIWLGEATAMDSLVFMQLYRSEAEGIRYSCYPARSTSSEAIIANTSACYCCSEPVPGHVRNEISPNPTEVDSWTRAALQDLVSRPWFTRLWVAQEVTTATRSQTIIVHCESLLQDFLQIRQYTGTYQRVSWLSSNFLADVLTCYTISSPQQVVEITDQDHVIVRTSIPDFIRDSRE